MVQKIDLLIKLLNEQISDCGLPELSSRKTKTFVAMNDGLLNLELNDIIKLVDDYGLLSVTSTLIMQSYYKTGLIWTYLDLFAIWIYTLYV